MGSFPVEDAKGNLMPYFIAVRNGDSLNLDIVADGNEHVIRARFADADYFYSTDIQQRLEEHLPRLGTFGIIPDIRVFQLTLDFD